MPAGPPTLEGDRLRLIRCTEETLGLDRAASTAFGRLLGAEIPSSWPPELYDDDARRYNLEYLRSSPVDSPWSMWYVVLRGGGRPDVLVGLAGFKGGPDEAGAVEVGYGVLPEYRRRGIAAEATAMLIELAFRDRAVAAVAAETFPELVGSIGVMMRNRMRFVGSGSEPGVIRYQVTREVWAAG
jgi:RimJ/RimL family protein N-acetyltransferase